MVVSYIDDSLLQLATAACRMADGATEGTVYFLDEPGEHELALNCNANGDIDFEVRWRDDWSSWGVAPKGVYETRLSGQCGISEFASAVLVALQELHREVGPEEYLKRWVAHPFPVAQMQRLEQLVS